MPVPTDRPTTGIPDPTEFGDISGIPTGQVLPMVIQRHAARKAGLHRDIRFGKDRMFSWATKKQGLPMPGEMQALFQTPLHEESYMHYSGELPRGMYGAGRVDPQEKGSVVIHKATPDQVVFTTAHTRYPQTYVMIRTGNKPTDWLVKNLTPKSLEEFAGPGVSFAKEHYNSVPSENVSELYSPKNTFSEKIDGARMLLKLKRHSVEAASYRPSATGEPIMHTSRLQLPRNLDIPPRLVDSMLVGEAYGTKESAYHGSHAAKIRLRALLGRSRFEPTSPHTGPGDAGMLTGSDAARVAQMGKAGAAEPEEIPWYRDPSSIRYKAMKDHLERNKQNILGPPKAPGEIDPWWEKEVFNPFHFPLRTYRGKPGTPAYHSQISYDPLTNKRVLFGPRQGTYDWTPGPVERDKGGVSGVVKDVKHWITDIIPHWMSDKYVDNLTDPKAKALMKQYQQAVKVQKNLPKETTKTAGAILAMLITRVARDPKGSFERVVHTVMPEESDAPRPAPVKMSSAAGDALLVAREVTEEVPQFLMRIYNSSRGNQEPTPKPVLPPLPKINKEKEPTTNSAPTSKVATAIGRVEPEVATHPFDVKDEQPKKKKPMEPDTRKLLQDKAAAEEAIPVQELGGILNSSLAESLRKQRDKKIQMRVALFNVLSKGKQPVGPEVPYKERRAMMAEILKHLPADKFHMPEMAETPEAQRAMWERIQAGQNPRTREGIVSFPETGTPTKVKILPEYDAIIRQMMPGAGKYEGKGVGAFGYSLPGEEKIVGRVGTGLSDELRQQMHNSPEQYIGRVARVHAMGQYPSGAYRAPALLAVHEG